MNEVTPDEYMAANDGVQMPRDFVEFAELMVEDEKIPKDVAKNLWGFIGKETILSLSDDRDRRRSENRYAIIRNIMMMSEPHYNIDINRIKDYQNMQMRNTVEVNRSRDGFERKALTTQIKQVITNRQGGEDRNAGFFSGIAKKLGLGKEENING